MPKVLKVSTIGFAMREAKRGDRESYGEVCVPTHARPAANNAWRTQEDHGFVRVVLVDLSDGRRWVGGFPPADRIEQGKRDWLNNHD